MPSRRNKVPRSAPNNRVLDSTPGSAEWIPVSWAVQRLHAFLKHSEHITCSVYELPRGTPLVVGDMKVSPLRIEVKTMKSTREQSIHGHPCKYLDRRLPLTVGAVVHRGIRLSSIRLVGEENGPFLPGTPLVWAFHLLEPSAAL